MMLKVDQMKEYSYDEAHCGYGDTRNSISNSAVYCFDASGAECLKTCRDQMFCDTGVGARRFTWPDNFTQLHSSKLAGMNTSRVIATGSWGSPSKEFATIKQDNRHAVLSFDFFDLIPANRDFLDGIRDGYALIEDENLWFVNDEINNAAKENRPIKGNHAAGERATQPILNIHSTDQNQNDASGNGAGFSSEYFGVTHIGILSHLGGSHV